MEKIERIKEDIKQKLSPKRYQHSVNVMEKCEELAKLYGENIELAKLVGIAHDIAKEMKPEESYEYVRKNNIEIDEIESTNPVLLHAKIGADICKKRYGFTNQMAEAIIAHTTGKADMDNLAKILYISDAISKERDGEYVNKARELANKSLNETVIYLIETFIKDCEDKRKKIHPNAMETIKALKSAIDDEKYNTVGGAIQIGVFKEKRFEIVGYSISEPVEKNNNPSVEDYYVFRGFKFKINELYDEKYVFTKKFALPFDKERDKLFKDALNKTYSMLGL